ncbi:MAG: glutamine amidotransferase [Betaproteobacteria bacterium HGW-Betaproteobacteria-10]|nr:MAG: glutamine amidotransferase [Betaproteobacteria bacterium HGW-Betaproteobacteria-10]
MQPVAIFRHSLTEGPGYFAIFLEQQGIPWRLIALDAGEAVPANADNFSGLCFMGGPMSVNDPLPWIASVCELIRDAVAKNAPVIGHCLGGQLISKALGGEVTRNRVKEIGWSAAVGETNVIAEQWLGERVGKTETVFQWHGETFSLPTGATRILSNPYCTNQMFALGPHLGMQCHVEMTPEMIDCWCAQWAEETIDAPDLPSVQTPDTMQSEMARRLPAMRQLAKQLYGVWINGLRR